MNSSVLKVISIFQLDLIRFKCFNWVHKLFKTYNVSHKPLKLRESANESGTL